MPLDLPGNILAVTILADNSDKTGLGAQRNQVAHHVTGAAQHGVLTHDIEHRDRGFRRDSVDRSIKEMIQHDIAYAKHPGFFQTSDHRHKVGSFNHIKPNSCSNAPHSIWPKVMCIS